jgi:hypothetical protein
MKFSLTRKKTSFELEVAEGNVLVYSIQEMTGGQRDAYFTHVGAKTKTSADGTVTGMKDFEGLYSNLLSKTVYDADNKLVPESTLQTWPATVQEQLFKVAQELNGLNKEDDEKKE